MERKNYSELSIHQKINYRSGWNIVIAYEGLPHGTNPCYCRFTECVLSGPIPVRCCERVYDIDRGYWGNYVS